MKDSDLTGDDLLRRIDELTNESVRDPAGGNGWRHVLFAAGQTIRKTITGVLEIERELANLHREIRELER